MAAVAAAQKQEAVSQDAAFEEGVELDLAGRAGPFAGVGSPMACQRPRLPRPLAWHNRSTGLSLSGLGFDELRQVGAGGAFSLGEEGRGARSGLAELPGSCPSTPSAGRPVQVAEVSCLAAQCGCQLCGCEIGRPAVAGRPKPGIRLPRLTAAKQSLVDAVLSVAPWLQADARTPSATSQRALRRYCWSSLPAVTGIDGPA